MIFILGVIKMAGGRPGTISEYLAAAAKEARPRLKELRALLKKVAPGAKEAIKWGSPVFEEERILFAFSAHRIHLNFMPTRRTLDHFREEIINYKAGRDTIQLPYDKPLPKRLITKIAKHRVRDVKENDARWM